MPQVLYPVDHLPTSTSTKTSMWHRSRKRSNSSSRSKVAHKEPATNFSRPNFTSSGEPGLSSHHPHTVPYTSQTQILPKAYTNTEHKPAAPKHIPIQIPYIPSRSTSISSTSTSNSSSIQPKASTPSHTTSLPLRDYTSSSHIRTTSISPPPRGRRKSKMPTYFLTGANRGIGLEFVRQLSSNPLHTIIAGVRSKSNDCSELESLNSNNNIHVIECDVSDPDSLSSLEFRVVEVLSKTGARLDYVFNVAGINGTSSDTSQSLDAESLNRHMATNVLGPAKIVEVLRRHFARGATVVNLTSGLGSLTVAQDVVKCCTYSISKAGLNMLTAHQAKDLKREGVRVICMDPGWVKTRMGGKGAMIEAKDSVGSMLEVIGGLKESDSGKFLKYDGSPIPW